MSFDSVDFTPCANGTLDNMKYGGINVAEIAQELKDNCDDAGAKETSIYMLGKESKLNEFIILDDGRGMDQDNLCNAMRLAYRHQHGSEDIGKFGVGLKNATIGLGDEIIIITRCLSKTLGVFLNINDMRRQNTFKPTQFVEDGSILKGWFPSSIWDLFDAQEQGTMILVKSIHNHHAHDVVELATNVHRSLNFNYTASASASSASAKANASKTKVYYSLEDYLEVKHVDAFYRNDPSACTFVYEAELRVYKDGREDVVHEVITSNRIRGKKLLRATPEKPLFYKFFPLKKGTQADKDSAHAEVSFSCIPSTSYKKMQIRLIEVSEEAYKKEGETGEWDGFDTRRRGFFFRRGSRMVGSCMALEEKMDDWSNRYRMEVTFDPGLDLEMGMRTQKQMSKSVHSACISDSLRILWRQLVGPRIRDRKAKSASDSDSVDETPEKGALSSFIHISKKGSPSPKSESGNAAPSPAPSTTPESEVPCKTYHLPESEEDVSEEDITDADADADADAKEPVQYEIDISNDSVQLKQGGKLISTIPGFSSASDLRDWIFRSKDPVALVNHIAKFFLDKN